MLAFLFSIQQILRCTHLLRVWQPLTTSCLQVFNVAVWTSKPLETDLSGSTIAALAPMPIGFAVLVAHLVLGPFTGCGINPVSRRARIRRRCVPLVSSVLFARKGIRACFHQMHADPPHQILDIDFLFYTLFLLYAYPFFFTSFFLSFSSSYNTNRLV